MILHYLNYDSSSKLFSSKHSFWWRRLEDVLKTSFIFVFRRRLQDVFKTAWSRPIDSSWLYVVLTSSRHLQDVLLRRFQDIFKTSQLNCSCWHLFKMSSRCIQNVSEMYSKDGYLWKDLPRYLFRTSSNIIMEHFLRKCLTVLSC